MVRGPRGAQACGMTTTPPEAPPEPGPYDGGPRATGEEIRDLGRLRRTSGPDKRIAGVAGGLARHLDIDPVILRVAFVVLVFFGGAGLILYGACWLLVPQDGDDKAPIHLDDRSRTVALVAAGVIAILALLGDSVGGLDFPWPLAIIALIALVALTTLDRRRERPRPTAPAVPHQQVPGTNEFQPTTAPGSTWAPPAPTTTWTPPPRVPNPRRRGPILFWFTLALAALGIGVLGIVDLAGAPVANAAYPALVVATCGVMLLVGAFYGRAGGLILVALLATLGMVGAAAADHIDDPERIHPTTASAVHDRYELGAGELVLDLSDVSDLAQLDGRTIRLQAGAARLEVVLPTDLDVSVDASVGLGHTVLFGEEQDGGGIDTSTAYDGGVTVPELRLDIDLGLGEVDVHTVDQPASTGDLR
jgi:phage shock protein PspC (stress-responsive transcriptional regulator)